jgi:hypothetical protein
MKTLTNTFAMTLAGAAALLAAACSSSKGGASPDGGGGGGSGGNLPPGAIALTPTSTGFVMEPTSGVIGAWYAYGDSVGSGANTTTTDFADSDCGKAGYTATQCSQITSPTPGQPFAPDATTGAMCTSGIAAQVLPAGTPDYTDFFGAGIGLDFNNPGGEGGVQKMAKDLSAYKGISFDFSGTMIPIGNKIRVNFPFTTEHGNDSPYFAANKTDDHSTLSTTTTNKVLWSNVQGPAYLLSQTTPVTPPAFDPTKVLSIQFQVFTNATTATPYSFCVNNLALLTE